MIKLDILGGLTIALEKGQSLKQAMISLHNAGYNRADIEAAAKYIISQQPRSVFLPRKKEKIGKVLKKPIEKKGFFSKLFSKLFPPKTLKKESKYIEEKKQPEIKPIEKKEEKEKPKIQEEQKKPKEKKSELYWAKKLSPEPKKEEIFSKKVPAKKMIGFKKGPFTNRASLEYSPRPVSTVVIILLIIFLFVLLLALISAFIFKEELIAYINNFF